MESCCMDFCYLDNESKINIKFRTHSIRFQGYADDACNQQRANMVAMATSPLGGFQPQRCSTCSLGCLQVSSARSVALLVGHLHDKGGRQLLALGVCATRVGAKGYRTVAAALLVC